MALRANPLRELAPTAADEQPLSRKDAASLRGFRLLPGGIFPAAFMRATANLTIPTSSVTQIAFDTADWDTCGDESGDHADWSMADLANNQLKIRIGGVYRYSGGVKYVASNLPNDDAKVFLTLLRNGTAFKSVSTHWIKNPTFATGLYIGGSVKCVEGDTITLETVQLTGVNQTIANGFGEPFLEGSWVAMFSGAA